MTEPKSITAASLIKPPSKKSTKTPARTRKRLKDAEPVDFLVEGLSHDGRGVARYDVASYDEHPAEKNGKKVFISFALPGEQVQSQRTNSRKQFEEADAKAVLANPHPQRQTPPCTHFGVCGGCQLQHWQPQGQIDFKQTVLAELFLHQALVEPLHWLEPITGDTLGYRSKARLGVRFVDKKNSALVGFRERRSNFLAELDACPILDPRVGTQISALKGLIGGLKGKYDIAQLELATGEPLPNQPDGDWPVALIVRHLKPLCDSDLQALKAFFSERNWQLYLQPAGPQSVYRVPLTSKQNAQIGRLYYQLPFANLTFAFAPTDFTQVNASINRQMTQLACELLALKPGERVLDLFCGLGNFSLAMARLVGDTGWVTGVEGSEAMTERAYANAALNEVTQVSFYQHDLTLDISTCDWAQSGFDAILIDPPRSGAQEIIAYLPKLNAKRLVYVSGNPATLARDTQLLLEQGYQLTHAGVMDMFCHTSHVESIARFERL